VLDCDRQTLRLSIDVVLDDSHALPRQPRQPTPSTTTAALLDAIRARVVLSGGNAHCERHAGDRLTVLSSWPLDDTGRD
jgi:hypothetical protein